MQFYLNGYKPGDPFIEDPHPSVAERPGGLPEDADVLIVGCGPAGLVLAAQMANFPDIRTVVIDRKDGPLEVGQADGVACRTVELFEAFGLADRLVNEGYWVNEVAFWRPDPQDRTKITRTGRIQDVEEGLSEMPHVIVNQARMLAYLLDHMERSASKLQPFYGLHASDIQIDTSGSSDYPVTVTLQHLKDFKETGETSTIRAKYVVGCDGSRSGTRTAIGRELRGDPMNQSWGVLDALAVTDFPDIRLKCAIHSANQGNILIIPREGGYLVRFYIELDNVRDKEMLENRSVTPEKLATVANRILAPYTVEVKDVGWWAVYEIGQRLCDKFDDVPAAEMATRLPRVFIAGDACHTHSAKAGQGMNVSMNDTWNLGWKLGAVLRGTAKPELLHTYSDERQKIAKQLIDFDREFAKMFSAHPTESGSAGGVGCRPRGVPAVLHHARPLHRRSRDQIRPVDDYRRSDVPAPRGGLPGRDALPLCPGHPAGRRQTGSPRPRRPGGRRLARLHLRRPKRPDEQTLPLPGAVRVLGVGRVSDQAFHAGRCGPRFRDRSPCHLPAGAS